MLLFYKLLKNNIVRWKIARKAMASDKYYQSNVDDAEQLVHQSRPTTIVSCALNS